MARLSPPSFSPPFLLLALLLPPTFAAEESPFLLVHKTASIASLKSSQRITVSIKLFNLGTSTAFQITLNDDAWPSTKFNIVEGNFSTSWEELKVGESLLHSFVLETKERGLFHGAPATVTFRRSLNAALQEAYSTPLPELDLLSERPEKKYEWLKKLAAKYTPLVSVTTIVGLVVYVLVSPSKAKSSKSKKRK